VDAKLYHDLTTGHSTTGVLYLVNQTPVSWFFKQQSMVETAMYGSKFVAAHLAMEQIIDMFLTLPMMSIPFDGPA
jgi:hypothetical protein